MAKNKGPVVQQEVNIIWNFITCAILYGLICYFNGPDKQQEMSQENVHKFALIISSVWFVINLIICAKQGVKVTLFPKKKDKKAVKEISRKAAKAAAGAATKKAAETFILKDPATGAERLFVKDENGQWVSEDGDTVLNMDDVGRFEKERENDRRWVNDENEKIRNRDTALDDVLREMDNETALKNKALDDELKATLKRIEKYGTTDDDIEHLKEIIRRDQTLNTIESDRNIRKGNLADAGYKAASATKYVTDKTMDAIGKGGGTAGKVGKAIYTGLTDQASALTDAYVNDKDMVKASKNAAVDSTFSIMEDQLSGGAKYVGTVAGEAAKDMTKATIEGKSSEEILKAGLVGGNRGFFKANTEMVANEVSGFFDEGGTQLYTDNSGNILGGFIDEGDIINQTIQDGANAGYDAFEQHVDDLNRNRKK